MILNKIVKRYNNTGMISVPENMIGMEVYIITKNDMDRTSEFLDRAIIKQKIHEDELSKMKVELENYINLSNARITYLEKILSFTTSKKQIEDENVEKQWFTKLTTFLLMKNTVWHIVFHNTNALLLIKTMCINMKLCMCCVWTMFMYCYG